jgi:hypothetical protein
MSTTPGQPRPKPDDPALRTAIIEGLQRGLSYGAAAEGAGIAERTLFAWLKQGKEDDAAGHGDTPHAQFSQYLARAHKAASAVLESKLYELAKGDKRPDITLALLRVREPDVWRERIGVEAAGDGSEDLAGKTRADLIGEIERYADVAGLRVVRTSRAVRAAEGVSRARRSGRKVRSS